MSKRKKHITPLPPMLIISSRYPISQEERQRFKEEWEKLVEAQGRMPIIFSGDSSVKIIPIRSPKSARFIAYAQLKHK